MSSYQFQQIGVVHSCFKEKFGIPRQPGLAPTAGAQLELIGEYNNPAAVAGLEDCSHLWIQFIFHEFIDQPWTPKVRPPRLGGNKKMGVFATRSPVRPNPIGLSVVKLERIDTRDGKVLLHLAGIDLLDGTPVIDIKPYVPYVDCVPEASNAFAGEQPTLFPVEFSEMALRQCEQLQCQYPDSNLRQLIIQVLQQDPRPKYQTPDPERFYGMRLLDFDLRWRYIARDGKWLISVDELAETTN